MTVKLHEHNDVFHIQLTNGQDVFGVVEHTHEDGITMVREPLVLSVTSVGQGLTRFLPYAEPTENVAMLKDEQIVAMNVVNNEARRHYNLSRFFAERNYEKHKTTLDETNVSMSGVISEYEIADGKVIHINDSKLLS